MAVRAEGERKLDANFEVGLRFLRKKKMGVGGGKNIYVAETATDSPNSIFLSCHGHS